jgi:hypothetical protein
MFMLRFISSDIERRVISEKQTNNSEEHLQRRRINEARNQYEAGIKQRRCLLLGSC